MIGIRGGEVRAGMGLDIVPVVNTIDCLIRTSFVVLQYIEFLSPQLLMHLKFNTTVEPITSFVTAIWQIIVFYR